MEERINGGSGRRGGREEGEILIISTLSKSWRWWLKRSSSLTSYVH